MMRRLGVYLLLLAGLVPIAFPFYWMATTALKDKREVFTPTPQWWPTHIAWANFGAAWTSEPFAHFFINSVLVSFAIVLLQIALASLAAFALARFLFPGRQVFFWLITAALIVPVQVTFIANFITLAHFGWLNTYAALIAPYAASAFGTFLFRQAFLAVPVQIEDAARLDGCTGLAFLWHVLLPLSRPTLVAFALVALVAHWNDYFWPLIVTNNNAVRTLPIGLGMFIGQEVTTDWNLLMAASLFVSAPMLLLFFFLQRYFVQSFLRAGIRG
ncbi:MAG: carbohydrate ABC transporter permease [Candidatus Eremiobacteraeota bacterium]|nr:carbohydrate ABC transporter permease [Candidatus Eremiobacteraeota bacterium]